MLLNPFKRYKLSKELDKNYEEMKNLTGKMDQLNTVIELLLAQCEKLNPLTVEFVDCLNKSKALGKEYEKILIQHTILLNRNDEILHTLYNI